MISKNMSLNFVIKNMILKYMLYTKHQTDFITDYVHIDVLYILFENELSKALFLFFCCIKKFS